MSMSKKDFIALADALRRVRNGSMGETSSFVQCVQAIADTCKESNPRFNRDRWFDYINGKCGPNGGAR